MANHTCSYYCQGDVHAMRFRSRLGATRLEVRDIMVAQGYVVRGVILASEADLASWPVSRHVGTDGQAREVTPEDLAAHPVAWIVLIEDAALTGEAAGRAASGVEERMARRIARAHDITARARWSSPAGSGDRDDP